jgi:hypothetical protein
MNIKARLARLEARVRPRSYANMPDSELWLELVECALELFYADGPADVVKRMRAGIAFLKEYLARGKLGGHVEETCAAWVAGFDGETGQGAYVDIDIAAVLRERDAMDQGRGSGIGDAT